MDRVCREGDGLFPGPKEIRMSCSCPDWAGMCKHLSAVLYGVGARLDNSPRCSSSCAVSTKTTCLQVPGRKFIWKNCAGGKQGAR